MTRLDASGDPSMEEILASIRRIIAEEPPGSRAVAPQARPAPQPAPAAAASTDRAPITRDASAMGSSAVKSDLLARFDPSSGFDSGRRTEPTLSSPQRPLTSAQSFPAAAQDGATERRDVRARSPDPAAPAVSVEAQLSDLLDGGELLDSSGQDEKDASPAPTSARSSRPGFTVSRDGFVPSEPSESDAADPFDFDLGPSPFSKRPANGQGNAPANGQANGSAKVSAPLPDDFEDPRPAQTADYGRGRTDVRSEPEPAPRHLASAPVPRSEPTPTETPRETLRQAPMAQTSAPKYEAPVKAAPAPAVEAKSVTPAASPSIQATLPPIRPSSNADSSGFARSVDMMSSRSARDSMQDVVTEAVNAAMSRPHKYSAVEMGGARVAVEVDDALTPGQQMAVRDAAAGGAGLPAVRNGDTAIRTMEDTVADLLRPMLKAWLAENMPRIIERALRREISEMSMPSQQHKTAAE
ncbi:MAG: DUF2497 domain-containing protein [Hyphomicrobium sp.]